MMLRLWIAAMCLPVVALAQSPMRLERPGVEVGDSWSFRQTDAFTNEVTSEFVRRVVGVTDTEITAVQEIKGTKGHATTWNDRNWNLVDDGNAQYVPSLDLVEFPLQLGDTWKRQYKATVLKSGATVVCYVTGKFVSRESVTVPAGTFDAGRIENDTECRATDLNAGVTRFANVQWFAPGIGRALRAEASTIANGRVRSKAIVELLDYHQADNPQPPKP